MSGADFRQMEELLHQQEQEMTDLLKINVNGHTEKKNGLTYLSWAWAWAEVLKIDPLAEWEPIEYPQPDGTITPCLYVGEGSAMVKTRVTVKGKTRVCMLPVMDHRNKAIKNPDAFAINTAIMRCMTKAISMHGLGLYIYAGEDLPEGEEAAEAPPLDVASRILAGGKHRPVDGVMEKLDEEVQSYLRTLGASIPFVMGSEGVEEVCNRLDREALDNDQKVALWSILDSKVRSAIKKEQERRRLMAGDGKAKQADVYRVADRTAETPH